MNRKYTRKQIQEAIQYWTGVLHSGNKTLNESSNPSKRAMDQIYMLLGGYQWTYNYTIDPINLGLDQEPVNGHLQFDHKPTFNEIRDEIDKVAKAKFGVKTYDFDNPDFGGEVITFDVFLGPAKINNPYIKNKPFVKVTDISDDIELFQDNKDFVILFYQNPDSTEFQVYG